MSESLSIVLPTYNEEENIREIVSDTVSCVARYTDGFEIILVDDGSTDRSRQIINQVRADNLKIKSISHSRRQGYGSAIRTGISLAKGKWVLIMDSDGQYRIDDFGDFWRSKDNYDFIIGYRVNRKDNLYRRGLAEIGNLLAIILLKKRIKDINCAFKLFKLEDLKTIPLTSSGNCIYFDILYNLIRNKDKFAQLPVKHYSRRNGRQTGGTPKVILRIIWEALRIICGKKI
ncbi:MAG: glycosyltransferase family 2 protein [Candidatus Omnitrophica bacterium]|nr:glycosyltransferase family 2 protein [Candidatus Omnitrophota bacterium]